MANKILIEITKTNDYNLLAELNEEIQFLHNNLYPKIFKPYKKLDVLKYFKEIVKNIDTIVYIAKVEEKAIGYLVLHKKIFAENTFQYKREFILIDQIVVMQEYQNRGIGKQLLDKAFLFATNLEIEIIDVNHWSLNFEAKNFFTKNKFQYQREFMSINLSQ